jgi:IclR family transcriptional regulator, pca regulon regulatory protein
MSSGGPGSAGKEEFVNSLARGLAVIRAFGPDRPAMTLSEVAAATNLNPAVARRFLLTLVGLGYAGRDGKNFMLRPRVLELGAGYLASINIAQIAQPHLQGLRDATGDGASLTTLDGQDIMHVCHVPARRLYRLVVTNGTRVAAYATAPGRVMLAHLDPESLDQFMSGVRVESRTDRTVTSPARFREMLAEVRERGYAVVIDEYEYGIGGIAAPVFEGTTVVGAVSCVGPSRDVIEEEFISARLPELRAAVRHISEELSRFPAFAHSVRWR